MGSERNRSTSDGRFSDGTPLTLDDVLFGWELASAAHLRLGFVHSAFERVERVERLDDRRLRVHFRDRHYTPAVSDRAELTHQIGERPLSWWAVRRVMEYSGRVNLWAAAGFGVMYAAYILAGDAWPPWMGRMAFQVFERMGGAPAVITGLVLLSAVPAAFQYGLWDSSDQDRCRRLELLLLTELGAQLDKRGNLFADTMSYKTTVPKVYAAGDMRRGQSLVVWAIREGRQAARSIAFDLMGKTDLPR